jgi:hypothetical protein
MQYLLFRRSAVLVVGAGLILAGCATRESVEHAQATADSAKQDAAAAMAAAQHAQSTADAAGSTAQAAATTAQAAQAAAASANDRLARMAEHHGKWRHRHHHHHHKKTAT